MTTSTYTHTIVAIFDDYASAEHAVDQLAAAGFDRSQIQIANDAAQNQQNRGPGSEHEGGIGAFFRRLFGMDDQDTDTGAYESAVRKGAAVVCVSSDEEHQDRAADILNSNGAKDIDKGNDSSRESDIGRRTSREPGDTSARSVPVIKEDLRVGKSPVQRGAVRVYNRVRDEPVEQQVNLREERVRVDRRPVDRPATEADFRNRDEVIEVTEMAEEPVVEKRSRVVEEVIVGKEVTNRTETVRDNLRRSEVKVERVGGAEPGSYDADFRSDFSKRFGTSPTARYESYAPAYQYGYESASNDRYRGRTWEQVEPLLRSDFAQRYPDSKWEQLKEAVRYGWDKVAGRVN